MDKKCIVIVGGGDVYNVTVIQHRDIMMRCITYYLAI